MTAKEYQAMILLECGEKISLKTAKVLMDRDADMEAEAIACGKYDIAPIEEPKRYHSESCWSAMQRGSECSCGLIPYDENYNEHLTPEELSEANSTTASLEIADQKREEQIWDEIPF